MFNLSSCLILSTVLFAVGAWGVIARRNLLIILMSIEVMLNAVILAFLAFSRAWGGIGATEGHRGHVFVLVIMAVAAAEAAVGLAILLVLFRHKPTVDADEMNLMKS
ncbi:MAG: NADH-quinone oxidoreductase subunit NuoK [Planctomycetota bacterium]